MGKSSDKAEYLNNESILTQRNDNSNNSNSSIRKLREQRE